MSFQRRAILGLIIWGSAVGLLAADFAPARRILGSLPQIDINAVGWTDVRLAVEVGADGAVTRTTALRATPGAAAPMESVVGHWRLNPAEYLGRRVAATVLVVEMFRPPQLFDNAALGSPPVNLAPPPETVPYPVYEMRPKYPVKALNDGVVLVEVLVGADGTVAEATLLGSGSGFETAALEAAREWIFRPARFRGESVPAYAYLIFGFRAPVTVTPSVPGLE